MRVLIIEDEEISFRRLSRMLSELKPEMEIDGPSCSISDVISRLSEGVRYDLIFSDIMLRGQEVFEAFKEVAPECPVVFTTAYDEYAFSAFRNNGVEYLLKPIDKESLAASLKKIDKLAGFKASDKSNMLEAVNEICTYKERILIWRGENLLTVKVKDIMFFYFSQRRVYATTADGSENVVHLTMNELESVLNPNMFFRLNRQYLANVEAINHISQFYNSRLSVQLVGCDATLILSKERSSELLKWLDR